MRRLQSGRLSPNVETASRASAVRQLWSRPGIKENQWVRDLMERTVATILISDSHACADSVLGGQRARADRVLGRECVLGRTVCSGGPRARADRVLGRTVCSGRPRARADRVLGRTVCSGGQCAVLYVKWGPCQNTLWHPSASSSKMCCACMHMHTLLKMVTPWDQTLKTLTYLSECVTSNGLGGDTVATV
jgi:hypothetical protein